MEMLTAIFGSPEQSSASDTRSPTPQPERSGNTPIQLTPEIFDRLFGDRDGE